MKMVHHANGERLRSIHSPQFSDWLSLFFSLTGKREVHVTMKRFSERKGFKTVSETIQTEGMNEDLKKSIWNSLDLCFWSQKHFVYSRYRLPEIHGFARDQWFNYFKKPIDWRPGLV